MRSSKGVQIESVQRLIDLYASQVIKVHGEEESSWIRKAVLDIVELMIEVSCPDGGLDWYNRKSIRQLKTF